MYVNLNTNTDLLTKALFSGEKRTKFCKFLLHYFYPNIETEILSDKAVAVGAAINVLPRKWIKAIISAVDFKETPTIYS